MKSPQTLLAVLAIAITLCIPFKASGQAVEYDTVYCDDGSKAHALALIVGNNGNLGNSGAGHVNLDFANYGDCDPSATVYLYDASTIICWYNESADSVECNYSMYDHGPSFGGFLPGDDPPQDYPEWIDLPVGTPNADLVSHIYYTRDSSIKVERVVIAPNVVEPHFMIQATRLTNQTDADMSGLVIGEGIDWNVPSDSGFRNHCDIDPGRGLFLFGGVEYQQDPGECLESNDRLGGYSVLHLVLDGKYRDNFWGVYAMDNATQVDPLGHFEEDSLWLHMDRKPGWSTGDSTENDMHMISTYVWNHTLGADGDLVAYTLLATGYSGWEDFRSNVDEGREWYKTHLYICCHIRGDINHSGDSADYSDIWDFWSILFEGGELPPCDMPEGSGYYAEADADGDGVCLVLPDLVYLIDYVYNGGTDPVPCGDSATSDTSYSADFTLDHVDGMSEPGVLAIGVPITFHLRANNYVEHQGEGEAILGMANVFRVYSPSGAQWTNIVGDTSSAFRAQTQFDFGWEAGRIAYI